MALKAAGSTIGAYVPVTGAAEPGGIADGLADAGVAVGVAGPLGLAGGAGAGLLVHADPTNTAATTMIQRVSRVIRTPPLDQAEAAARALNPR
jgi:hypothetical protein